MFGSLTGISDDSNLIRMDESVPMTTSQQQPNKPAAQQSCDTDQNADARLRRVKKKTAGSAIGDRIIQQLNELNNRLRSLEEHQAEPVSDTPSDYAQLMSRISSAIGQQNQAIAGITSALDSLQESISRQIAAAICRQAQGERTIPTEEAAAADPDSACVESQTQDGNPVKAAESTPEAAASQSDTWTDIKNAFLRETHEDESPDHSRRDVPANESAGGVLDRQAAELESAELDKLLDRISVINNLAELKDDELREAVRDRDRLISRLVDQLRSALQRTQSVRTEQIQNLSELIPAELQTRVEKTLASLSTQARLGELELSLERARVARQMARLETTQEKLQATARSLGLTLHDDGTLEGDVEAVAQGTKGRRWLGVLGFSH